MAIRFKNIEQCFQSYIDNPMVKDSEKIGKRMWILVKHSNGTNGYISMVSLVEKDGWCYPTSMSESSGLGHYDCPQRLLDQIAPKTAAAKAWRVKVKLNNSDASAQRVRTRTR